METCGKKLKFSLNKDLYFKNYKYVESIDHRFQNKNNSCFHVDIDMKLKYFGIEWFYNMLDDGEIPIDLRSDEYTLIYFIGQ